MTWEHWRERDEWSRAWAERHLPDLPAVYVMGALGVLLYEGVISSAEVHSPTAVGMIRRRVESRMQAMGMATA